ncbi:alpha/beta hydrolase [Crocosphaera sp.]|uniref:alpha/beta hydrolase n=1 Tax=Crocosphaera sp. TaxID=2729996 RepID=UPI003F27B4D1|nr:DUF1749 domain-containing protein [Crocosphaera sp.]
MINTYLLKLSSDELSKPLSKRLPCSILFSPTSLSTDKPAIIYLHDWNKYPYAASICDLGQTLANQGYFFLSLGISRRGVEGQMTAVPRDDIEDINRGVNYLKDQGCQKIILVGEGIGSLSVLQYQLTKNESTIKGLILIRPLPNLKDWLKSKIGDARYQKLLEKSAPEVVEGSEELWVNLKVPYTDDESLLIYQSYQSWLSWWSPKAETKIFDLLTHISLPILAISPVAQITQKTKNTTIINLDKNENLSKVIDNWIEQKKELSSSQLNSSELIQIDEIITVKTSDNRSLIGLLWEDNNCQENKTIIIHVRGKTGTPITEPLTADMAEIYVNNKIATLVIELHRSGYGGSLESLAEMDSEDINAFVKYVLNRGYTRIILTGQSLGSNSIMRYCVQYPHPNIIAMVHFAPTQDCANWLKSHVGSDDYNKLLQQAEKAITNSSENQGLIGKPPYDKMLSPSRPDAWLSWWGPNADTANLKTISQVTIPILMLCGSNDFFNDRERLDTLKNAAINSPIVDIIWYEGCGHNFANFEKKAANDVVNWLNQL